MFSFYLYRGWSVGSILTRLHDVLCSGTACGFGRDDDAAVVKVQLCFLGSEIDHTVQLLFSSSHFLHFGHADEYLMSEQIWEKTMGVSVVTPVTQGFAKGEATQEQAVKNPVVPHRVAFIGLGAMGFGMASWLIHEKFTVCGYDVSTWTRSVTDS